MMAWSKPGRPGWAGWLLFGLAVLLPGGMHWLFFGEWQPALLLAALAFILPVTLVYQFLDVSLTTSGAWRVQAPAGVLLMAIFGVGSLYFLFQTTWAAGVFLAGVYILSLVISRVLLAGLHGGQKPALLLLLAGLHGGLFVGAAELEGRFSNEEFFSGVEAAVLAVQWLLVALAQERLAVPLPVFRAVQAPVRRQTLAAVLVAALVLFWGLALPTLVIRYQHSAYPLDVPDYPGISEGSPFICGSLPPGSTKYSTEGNASRLIELVMKNPNKGAPEYGLLALLQKDPLAAQQFKAAILQEADARNYASQAGSVKYGQYEAALRIYYFVRVRQAFPGLFDAHDEAALLAWFAAINVRAQTVEWVDWMYALAFSKIPQGPYANQDIGAGLLALLETNRLGDPALSASNRAYLDAERRGWAAIFRNTDDSIAYQHIWNTNAWLQSQDNPNISLENQSLAFAWMLRLALPDGRPFNINPYYGFPMTSAAHLGAALLNEPDLVWLEGRALEWLAAHGIAEAAAMGAELQVNGEASAPQIGSCLLYGSSGLPDQPGPLAPDKVVLRDGWEDDSQYVLLNLRFTGWHRYKATNAIDLIYRNAPLVMAATTGQEYGWLPAGRQQFRDKRIPRENLNSFNVPVQGLQAVNRALAGLRSRWAQDPPYYAGVIQFETVERDASGPDTSVTRINDWHGWDFTRTIHLYPDGPVVVHDRAAGPQGQKASLFWHLADAQVQGNRARLGAGGQTGEAVFVPLAAASVQAGAAVTTGDWQLTPVQVSGVVGGTLDVVTVFLPGEWVGAEITYQLAGAKLLIKARERTLSVPIR